MGLSSVTAVSVGVEPPEPPEPPLVTVRAVGEAVADEEKLVSPE